MSIKVYGFYAPFDDETDDIIAEVAQWQTFVLIQCAILNEYLSGSEHAEVMLIIIANLCLPLVIIFFLKAIVEMKNKSDHDKIQEGSKDETIGSSVEMTSAETKDETDKKTKDETDEKTDEAPTDFGMSLFCLRVDIEDDKQAVAVRPEEYRS
eukprot:CAMPEP_0185769972 /NCGR_PEP_ID=MMETSP1174-20130828/56855_1 /TAXON_ID=35687 /ORGANISM="Dictyocha speculum, Strain CCMP1381" /LENGTH=152 /DNA_ID=CAMNT_0028455241 /DNA_START=166 /DNA_END=624 /DNA_ORIENTATION=-